MITSPTLTVACSCFHVFADASHRYQALDLTEGSPQLPAGYLSLAPLLLIPPAWRAVMDPVLNTYKKKWREEDRKETKTSARA